MLEIDKHSAKVTKLRTCNESMIELASRWYFSEKPGSEYEAPPDEVEGLMELCDDL